MKKQIRFIYFILPTYSIQNFALVICVFFAVSCSKNYENQRQFFVSKYAENDITVQTMIKRSRLNPKSDMEKGDYWKWRIDQYLHEIDTSFRAVYDIHTKGKSFSELYHTNHNFSTLKTKIIKKTKAQEINLPNGFFSNNPLGNAHTGESAVFEGVIYIAYQGPSTDPYICSYEIESNIWKGPYKVGDSELSKKGNKTDHHGKPSIAVDAQGHIHVVFGGHGGNREDGLNPHSIDTPHVGGRFKHFVSTNPKDVKNFESKNDVSPYSTYSQLVKMGNGDIYLFTRAGTHKSPWIYYQMKAGSSSFDSMVKITKPIPKNDASLDVDTFYLKAYRLSENKMGISYLNHICSFTEVHRLNRPWVRRYNAYFMEMDTDEEKFYSINGKEIALPLDKVSSDNSTLAYLSKNGDDYVYGTRSMLDKNGEPILIFENITDKRVWKSIKYKFGNWTEPKALSFYPKETIVGISAVQVLDFKQLSKKQAGFIYINDKNESVFAIAEMNESQTKWHLKENCIAKKSVMELATVKDLKGNNVGHILSVAIHKNAIGGQALYLWANGKLRSSAEAM